MILLFVFSLFSFAKLSNEADPRIVGGRKITISQAPYQVSLRWIMEDNVVFGRGFFCGGSLISPSVVLTAAHCLYDESGDILTASQIQVVGGNADLSVKDSKTFVSAVSSFKVHESYENNDSFNYDIAVLKLKSNISETTNSTTKVISLPMQSYPVGASCLISGWGTTSSKGKISQELRGTTIPINNASDCNLPQHLNGTVKKGMFCAGLFDGGYDACQGDSGGPLSCDNILYGITSHGVQCALPNYPGIYTDVYYYREWILKNSAKSMYLSFKMVFSSILVALSQWRIYIEAYGGW